MNNSLTIVVTSCDTYADLWAPFAVLFNHYWPDCPYDVVLVTESPTEFLHETKNSERRAFSRIIPCGKMGWGDRLTSALSQINTPYVLMLCDDYFLCDRVLTDTIEHYLCLASKYAVGNLRLIPNPVHSCAFSEQENLGEYRPRTAYCIATQAGIWDTRFLKRIAKGYNSIWEFERLGSFRPDLDKPLVGTRDIQFPFEDVIHKGKWERFGVRLCQRNSIPIDFSRRNTLTDMDCVREHLKGAILGLNPTWVVRMQNLCGVGKK